MEYKILNFPITMLFGNTESTVFLTLLLDEQNMILVDCGFIGALSILERRLCDNGLTLGQITGLVLTHHDHDHMGTAAALKRINPHMQIYASALEEPYISAKEKPLRLRQAEEIQKSLPPQQQDFGKAFCDMLRRVEPVEIDTLLRDGDYMDWCGGCTILATPGHTPGHISLLMERDSIVITGDAIALEDGKPAIANPQFALDINQAAKSMEKLLSMRANAYYCSHGGNYSPAV